MRSLLILITCILFSLSGISQTVIICKNKSDKIFTYFNTHPNYKRIKVSDSIIVMLHDDKWFNSLSTSAQKAKIWRIKYYQKVVNKNSKNNKYIKGWINRIYSTSTKK